MLELTLKSPAALRAVDIKIEKGHNRLIIEAYKGGKWIPHPLGLPGSLHRPASAMRRKPCTPMNRKCCACFSFRANGFIKCMRTFDPVTTNRLRAQSPSRKGGKSALLELHVYKATPPKIWLSALKLRPPAAGK